MKIDRCPRCGTPGYLVADERELKNGTQVYYFVVHKYRNPITGEVKTRKCAIGSEGYIYVTKTHTLPYHGVILRLSNVVKTERLLELAIRSLENTERHLKMLDPEKKTEEIEKLKPKIMRLVELVNSIYELVSKFGNHENERG